MMIFQIAHLVTIIHIFQADSSYIGYNGHWTKLDNSEIFVENDIVKVELNSKDRAMSYFKNKQC